MPGISDERIHEGHRDRMRAKLLSHGERIFDTYELLEMLLYSVIPYKDTNPIAKRLLAAFGSLDGVLTAGREELMKVQGIGERAADYLLSVGRLSLILGAEILPRPSVEYDNYDSVGKFLSEYFEKNPEVRAAVLSFDNGMRLISIDDPGVNASFGSGGYKSSAFMDIAIKRRASVIITAQNNYYGPAYPTPADRATSLMICDTLAAINIQHLEHYLICGKKYMSVSNARRYRFSSNIRLVEFERSRAAALAMAEEEMRYE